MTKRVVVTGGASGIGLATARRFASDGAEVAIFDLSQEAIERNVETDPLLAGRAFLVDVSRPEEVAAAFKRADDVLGGVDVLIANAGISYRSPVLEISPDEWEKVLATNLSGIFYTAQEAARRMEENEGGGVILMTASTNGQQAHSFYAHYNASKAGVILLARTMALELAPRRIRVNAVCPGYVLTPMQLAEYTPEMLEEVNRKIPLGRHASPEEIAALFAFLASHEAAYITGQAIAIDGGETA